MKKILILFTLTLLITSCGEKKSIKELKQICEEDVKKESASFDCGCQIDIFKKTLSEEQIDLLHKFIITERTDKNAALAITQEPKFADLFKELVKISPEIEKQCRK